MSSYLTFDIAGRRFGIAAATLREITRAVAVAPLPKAPAIVDGMINLRGTLVPVFDVRQRFGVPSEPVHPDQHFVIAHARNRTVALRVDRALDLVTIDQAAIEAATSLAPGAQMVAGIARLPDGVLVIHDLDRFLSLDEERELNAAVKGA